jgi:hypothetical protein
LVRVRSRVRITLRAPVRPLVQWIEYVASNHVVGVRSSQGRPYKYRMKLFEATIRTADGREFKDRVGAETAQEARLLLQSRYGPRAVPYLPKIIPS